MLKVFKRCPRCREEKRRDDFYKNKDRYDGLKSVCKNCHNDAEKERRKRNSATTKATSRRAHFRRQYGMTLEDWDARFYAQGGVCALCGTPPRPNDGLVVDHCHATGRIRGLIHRTCNVGIGFFGDDPDLLRKGAIYLEAN